ncbi:hypothetical protein [Secundilactobacillus kimchicus]|nr:hypothetical protein [Secundilactobacillus kimchicus]
MKKTTTLHFTHARALPTACQLWSTNVKRQSSSGDAGWAGRRN